MTKRRWKESISSFIRSHTDPEKKEQLKGTKKEIEEKVDRILRFIKDDPGDSNVAPVANFNKEQLIELVEDFQTQYQSLYTLYDNLMGDLKKNVHGKPEKVTSESSTSSSDSEPEHSSGERENKTGRCDGEFHNVMESMKQELGNAIQEVAELKTKLVDSTEENESMGRNLKDAEKTINDLKVENERLQNERLRLLEEREDLNLKLETSAREEAGLIESLEVMKREKNSLIMEKEILLKRIEEGEKSAESLEAMTGQLKDEKAALKEELKALVQHLESAEQESAHLNLTLKTTEEEKNLLALKLQEAEMELEQEQNTVQEFRAGLGQLNDRLREKERELSTAVEMHSVRLSEASTQINDLETQLSVLEQEKNSLTTQKGEIEASFEIQATEACQLREENLQKQAQIEQLEMVTKGREEEIYSLMKKLEDSESVSSSKIEILLAQTNNLQLEVDSLQAQKRDVEEQMVQERNETGARVRDLLSQIDTMQKNLKTFCNQKNELEAQLEKKSEETSAYLVQMTNLKQELASKITDHEKVVAEKDNFTTFLKGLELELESLSNQRDELLEKMQTKNQETDQLRVEKQELEVKFLELVKALTDKGEQFSTLQRKLEDTQNEASSQTSALTKELNNLHAEADSLKAQKQELEVLLLNQSTETEKELVKKNEEISDFLIQIQTSKSELASKTSDQQRLIEEKEELVDQLKIVESEMGSSRNENRKFEDQIRKNKHELNQLVEEKEELQGRIIELEKALEERDDEFSDLQKNLADREHESSTQIMVLTTEVINLQEDLQKAERKMKEVVEETLRDNESKDQIVTELESTVEDLKRDLEVKGEELRASMEDTHTIEVKLRLSNQKLRVTEQLLTEKEESYRSREMTFRQEQRVLKEKTEEMSGIISTHLRTITDISEKTNTAMAGLESVVRRFEEEYRSFQNYISVSIEKLLVAKIWIRETNKERDQLKKEVGRLMEQLRGDKEREIVLKEKIEKLDSRRKKEESEKQNLMREVSRLENKLGRFEEMMDEKERQFLGLGEEKREAIRQLCLWVDYQYDRCEFLKVLLSKRLGRRTWRSS